MHEAVHALRLACLQTDTALAILGFAGTDAVEHLELLSFEDARTGLPGAIDALLAPHVGGGSTPAAEALALACRLLERRSESDRVVVMVTDGEANGGPEVLRRAVGDAEDAGITVIGFHVGDDPTVSRSLARAFPESAVIPAARLLGPAVLGRLGDRLAG